MSWKVTLTLKKEFPTLARAEKGMKSLIKKATGLDWDHGLDIKQTKEK
jgi:hypothetical protein